MIGHPDCQDFQLLDVDGKIAFQGSVVADTTKNGIFHLLDFSNFREEGTYRLQCGTNESLPFPIEENIWLSPLFSGLNFYFCQRCGYDVPGIHQACHKDWFGFHGNERKVINGGWHDAADLSQGYWRTAMGVYALLSNLELIRKDKALAELSERMHSEIKWGIDWLLNTRFEDGYHMSWSVMRIYTDNLAGTLDDNVSQAQKYLGRTSWELRLNVRRPGYWLIRTLNYQRSCWRALQKIGSLLLHPKMIGIVLDIRKLHGVRLLLYYCIGQPVKNVIKHKHFISGNYWCNVRNKVLSMTCLSPDSFITTHPAGI